LRDSNQENGCISDGTKIRTSEFRSSKICQSSNIFINRRTFENIFFSFMQH